MKVLYDYQIFDYAKIGGISRYFYELMNHLNNDKSMQVKLSLLYSSNEYLKNNKFFSKTLLPKPLTIKDYKDFSSQIGFIKEKLAHKLNSRYSKEPYEFIETTKNKAHAIQEIKKGNFDIFHPTHHGDYFLPYIGNKPFVYTVYDIIPKILPEFFLHYEHDNNKELLDKAQKIIAISESTKRDIINVFNIDETKVEVVYLASSLEEDKSNVSLEFRNKLPKKYLLFVGYREKHKNFLFFIEMFSSLKYKEMDISIVCTGSPFSDTENYLFNKLGIQDRLHYSYANDQELAFLYKNAHAFIFSSIYEGFGLPVLEAFSCGCPVIVSNTSSLTEIGEDAVVYFEPKNPESLLNALKTVINNEPLRQEKIDKGYEQLKKFSWEQTAIKTKKVYEQVLLNV